MSHTRTERQCLEASWLSPTQFGRLIVAAGVVLVAASCGGSTSGATTSVPAITTSAATSTSSTAVVPIVEVTAQLQPLLVIEDADLRSDLRALVPTGFDIILDGPAFFSAGPWQWRGQRFEQHRGDTLELVSGTRLFESETQAAEQFSAGVAAVRSGATDSKYTEVLLVAVPMIADESLGVRLVGGPSDHIPFTTTILFRRGSLLGFVSISRSDDRASDTEAAIQLAEVLDGKVEDVLAGELRPDPEAGLALAWPRTPQRQLNSFAFEAIIGWDVAGDARLFDVTGIFNAPDKMRCELRSSTGDTHNFFSDGTGLATESDGRWRYLAPDDPLVELAGMCPGNATFFGRTFTLDVDFAGFYLTSVGRTIEFGREASDFILTDSNFPYGYGQIDELRVAFDVVDGWTVYMNLVTEVDPADLFVPDGTSGEAARLLVEVTILRPDDPTVVVDVPEVIDPA